MSSRTVIPETTPLGAAFSRASASRIARPVGDEASSSTGGSPRVAWWLWPHLLSLDAPLVAVVWQRWWAHSAGIRLTSSEEAILGLGVWMIYLGDRLADTAPQVSGDHETARHRFYRRRRRVMRPFAALAFLVLAWLTPWVLPVGRFFAGLGLLALAGGYFWLIHRRTCRGWSRILPKEAVVGAMFAVGTVFFVLGRVSLATSEWWVALPLFGGLCFFNCALITRWEQNAPDIRESSSLLNAFPRVTAHLIGGCLLLALLSLTATIVLPAGSVFAPIAVSALLLAALDRYSRFLSADALRLLADVALLTPWLGLLLPPRLL